MPLENIAASSHRVHTNQPAAIAHAETRKPKFLDAANNRCRGMFPTVLRDGDGGAVACAAIPPPYFATPVSAWWFERHTFLAVQCQYDIQTDTLLDLDAFYPNITIRPANITSPRGMPIVLHGEKEYHSTIDLTKFEAIPPECARQLETDRLRLRILPMNSFLTKSMEIQ